MNPSHFDLALDELFNQSVGKLRTAETFDCKAFVALMTHMRQQASSIADDHVVSKQMLTCLMQARDAIHRSAQWVPEAKHNLQMADEFEMLLAMVAFGIDPATKRPRMTRSAQA